jgi:uncharacterized Ntn-hydrolase superfamily protein
MRGSSVIRRFLITAGTTIVAFSVGMQAAQATWSVVAVDPDTGEVGVAVASCVGFEVSVVPVLVPGVGAAASQAAISQDSGERLVEALASGATAAETIDAVVAADDAPETRQFGVVVLDDDGAGWTGADTFDVALDRRSTDGTVSVQGNILVSEGVVDAAIAAFEASDGDLPDRLLAALVAGADEGGDSRCGDQTAKSAAMIVARPGDQNYAFTANSVVGVDPADATVPSVFISVLVEAGAERAPDRLVAAWVTADQEASSVVIRDIDEGADTSVKAAGNAILVFLGVVVAVVVIVIFVVIRSRRRAQSTNTGS